MNITPHVAQNTTRSGGSATDRRTTRHAVYEVSQQRYKTMEEFFGCLKTVAGRGTKYRGEWHVRWAFTLAAAAYDLVRMRALAALAFQQQPHRREKRVQTGANGRLDKQTQDQPPPGGKGGKSPPI